MKIRAELDRRLRLAMLNRDSFRRDVIRFVRGKLDLMKPNLSDAEVHAVLRGLLKEAREIPTMFTEIEIAEIADLSKWAVTEHIVPAVLTQGEIVDKLMHGPGSEGVIEKIKAAPDENKAMGPAMGILKRSGAPVDADDVRVIVHNIRNAA